MNDFIFLKGFFLSLSLIIAIGPQNIFILKQGLAKNHIFLVCSICFLCDGVLMNLGIFGVGEFLAHNKIISIILAVLGILFALYYAFLSLKAFFTKPFQPDLKSSNALSCKEVTLLTLAFTLFNPQVYLDTLFLVGAASLSFNFNEKLIFSLGAISASFLWFFALGYGAKKLSSCFKTAKIAKFIELFIVFIMFALIYSLIKYLITLNIS